MADTRIKLTAKNLLRYGEIVLAKQWTSPAGLAVTQRYIIWDTCKMNGDTDPEVLKRSENKKKIYKLIMANDDVISMAQV